MRDCKHLILPPEKQLPGGGTYSSESAKCNLKTPVAIRINMAEEAREILGYHCPANRECHYFPEDLCEKCPEYEGAT